MQIFTSPTCRGGGKIFDFDGGVATVILSGAKNLKKKNATRPFAFAQGSIQTTDYRWQTADVGSSQTADPPNYPSTADAVPLPYKYGRWGKCKFLPPQLVGEVAKSLILTEGLLLSF